MQYWIANINIQTYHIEEVVIQLSMQENNFSFQNCFCDQVCKYMNMMCVENYVYCLVLILAAVVHVSYDR